MILFIRSLKVTLVILAPPLLVGTFITVGINGAFGPSLSIMNMVILPSLVGISVDKVFISSTSSKVQASRLTLRKS